MRKIAVLIATVRITSDTPPFQHHRNAGAIMLTEVFISYRRSDLAAAQRLGQCLKARGISYWFDGMIGPGQDWRDEIVENIKLAKILVILFSEAANSSNELKKELSVADQSQTIIAVVRIENVQPRGGYAYELNPRNWFNAFDNPQKQLDEVADWIAKALVHPGDLKLKLEKSSEELARRRRRQLFGYYGLLRNNAFLIILFIVSSALLFLVYDYTQSTVSQYIDGGTDPFLAFMLVIFVTSIASPIVLFESLRHLEGWAYLIPVFSIINILAVVLMLRNFAYWTIERWSERRM